MSWSARPVDIDLLRAPEFAVSLYRPLRLFCAFASVFIFVGEVVAECFLWTLWFAMHWRARNVASTFLADHIEFKKVVSRPYSYRLRRQTFP